MYKILNYENKFAVFRTETATTKRNAFSKSQLQLQVKKKSLISFTKQMLQENNYSYNLLFI